MSKTPAVVRLSDTLSNVNFSELISNAFGAFEPKKSCKDFLTALPCSSLSKLSLEAII